MGGGLLTPNNVKYQTDNQRDYCSISDNTAYNYLCMDDSLATDSQCKHNID